MKPKKSWVLLTFELSNNHSWNILREDTSLCYELNHS